MAVAAAIVAALTLTTAAQAVELDPVAFSPEVSGVVQVGETLTAVTDNAAATYDYEWSVAGVVVGTTQTYDVVAEDALKSLVLSVAGHQDGYADTTLETAAVTVQKATFEEFSTSLSGSLVVGKTLKAKVPASGPYTVQWRRDGVAISGATSSTYTLRSADAGHRMSVKVVQSAPGYVTQKSIANATSKVKRVFTASKAPKISGTVRVGQVLKASVGEWSPGVKSYTYQWNRDGVAIKGATGKTRRLTVNDLGHKITVTVTGHKPGYLAKSRTSGATDKVRKGHIEATKPVLTGTTRAGNRLSVRLGTVTPGSTKITYQWLRNGNAIKGATSARYGLKNVDAGRRISVRVTYVKDGYVTTTRTSALTAEIRKRPLVMQGNGTWEVGVDVQPGIYYTASETEYCEWTRKTGNRWTGGTNTGSGRRMISISASDKTVITAGKITYVTQSSSTDPFRLAVAVPVEGEGCGGWIRYDGTGLKRSTMPGDGMFGVGVDVKAGTYKSTGNSGCEMTFWKDPDGATLTANLYDPDFQSFTRSGTIYLQLDSAYDFIEVNGCNKFTKVS
ncbi:hypothetical protein [Demequina sp. NBRC 110054]|uniref:hypothetical protein n=1 Tax=Demequina sp. NBRC 110054 TaxID=1570343 RepID=UPI000A045819|nr:hypothetical protein [Demequina sp. NBRC 110054]